MSLPTIPQRPRRVIFTLAIGGAILAAVVAVGLYGLPLAPQPGLCRGRQGGRARRV